ncbi:hypothetical protein ES705_22258 [subsurface metagenome]
MRTAATKLSGEEYNSLKEYADSQGSSVSAILRELAKGLTDGQTEPGVTKDLTMGVRGKIPYCPRCSFIMYYDFRDSTLACPRCGCCFKIDEPDWQREEPRKI